MVHTGVRAECSSLVRAGRRVGVGRVPVAGGLGLVHAGLAEVTATDSRSWPTAALADALRGMEAAAAALDATRALVLGAFDARGGGHDDGANSTVSWLRGHLRVSPGEAARRVRVAGALPTLPLVAAALGRGEISHAHAEVITGLARGGSEAPPRARRAAALLSLIRRVAGESGGSGGSGGEPRARGRRPLLVITADLATVLGHAGAPAARTAGGAAGGHRGVGAVGVRPRRYPGPARRASHLLNLGRTARLFTRAQDTALAVRDGGCVGFGCHEAAHRCDNHHLISWTRPDGKIYTRPIGPDPPIAPPRHRLIGRDSRSEDSRTAAAATLPCRTASGP